MVSPVGEAVHWLEQHPNAASALATFGLLVVAAVAAGLDWARRRAQRKAAEGWVRVLAYRMRRQLAKGLEDPWPTADDGKRAKRAADIQSGWGEVEPRMERMVAKASSAGRGVANTARQAADLFWRAAEPINEAAEPIVKDGLRPHDVALSKEERERFADAEGLLRRCVSKLKRLGKPIREANRES